MPITIGYTIKASHHAVLMATITSCRARWSNDITTVYTPIAGHSLTAATFNNYRDWLEDVRTKTVPANTYPLPSVAYAGGSITAVHQNALQALADQVLNHCHSDCHSDCHSNCHSDCHSDRDRD